MYGLCHVKCVCICVLYTSPFALFLYVWLKFDLRLSPCYVCFALFPAVFCFLSCLVFRRVLFSVVFCFPSCFVFCRVLSPDVICLPPCFVTNMCFLSSFAFQCTSAHVPRLVFSLSLVILSLFPKSALQASGLPGPFHSPILTQR